MGAEHWIYRAARSALVGIPTHDIRADAEDAAHDCIVQVLELDERPEDPITFAGGGLRQFAWWESQRNGGKSGCRRHYGRRFVGHQAVYHEPLPLDGYLGTTDRLDDLIAACDVLGLACREWPVLRYEIKPGVWVERSRPSWTPWAWLLYTAFDWDYPRLARAIGCSPQNVRQSVKRFQEVIDGLR